MRRIDIFKSINTIYMALERSGLIKAFESTLNLLRETRPATERGEFNTELLKALNLYSSEYMQFTETEQKIASIFGLDSLADPEEWAPLIIIDRTSADFFTHSNSVRFAYNHLPKLLILFVPDYQYIEKDKLEPTYIQKEDRDIISITISDVGSEQFTPERLIALINGMNNLYNACSKILGMEDSKLVLIGCDSGSLLSIDLEGVGDAIRETKEAIISLCRAIAYNKQNKLSRNLELLAQSLPIIQKVSELERDGSIEPETAERLKYIISSSVTDLLIGGITIPEMDQITHIDPIELMTPEPKQITEGRNGNGDEGSEIDSNNDEKSEE